MRRRTSCEPRPHPRIRWTAGSVTTAECWSAARISAWPGASTRRPSCRPRMQDIQLLPIDAAAGGINPGECALVDDDTARNLTSEGTFVLAWSTEHEGEIDGRSLYRRSAAHRRGRRGGALRDWHPADLGAAVLDALVAAQRNRPGRDRRRDHRLRQPGRRAELPHRPQHGAGLRPARQRAGGQHRPPVRQLAAGDPLRRAGGDERHPGRGDRRRRRKHDPRADGNAGHPADAGRDRHGPWPQSIKDATASTSSASSPAPR